jgi:2-C-methyl-D-erythritol 4-phosphate cytidylyltransferase
VWAIVVAGGSGRRFGGPKQFLTLAGRPVASWSVATARAVADGIVLVVPADMLHDGDDAPWLGDGGWTDRPDRVVVGGDTRAASVRAGLAAVPDDASIILVHDAARPLATKALFAAVVEAVASGGAAGAIPVVPVADTLKRVTDGAVAATVERDGLVTVQTPQAFVAATLRSAHATTGEATDDAGMLELLGETVRTVPGDPRNLKLTRPDDLAVAELLIHSVHG